MNKIIVKTKEEYENKIKNKNILNNSFNVYVRVSTIGQIDNTSLNNQSEIGIEYVTKNHNKYDTIIIWREEGKSGDDLSNRRDEDLGEMIQRPLMSIIIDSWKNGLIKNLWIYDLSRLSRNEEVSIFIKNIIYKNGIDLFVGNTKYDFDNKFDKLMFSVLSSINEFENHQRFEKGLMGKLKNLENNKWWGGPIPFGYKLDENNRLVEHEFTGKIVRKMFYYYGNRGKSTKYIKSLLERIGVTTNRGNNIWNLNSIRLILQNEMYCGEMKYEVKGLKGKSKEYCKSKGCLHHYKIKCDKIINYELYNRVQKRFSNSGINQQIGRKNKNFYLLRGLLFCGCCGKVMGGRINYKNNINLYSCSSNTNRWRDKRIKTCINNKSINMDVCDKLVWDTVLEVWENSHLIKEKYKEKHLPNHLKDLEKIKKEISNKNSRIVRIKSKIGELNKRKDEVLNQYIIMKLSNKRYKELDKLNGTQIGLEEEKISSIKKEINILEQGSSWCDWLDDFKNHLKQIKSITNKEDKYNFLNEIVDKIEVYWDSITNTHSLKIFFKWRIVKDRKNEKEGYVFEILEGKDYVELNNFNTTQIKKLIKKKKKPKTSYQNYSTVTDLAKFLG